MKESLLGEIGRFAGCLEDEGKNASFSELVIREHQPSHATQRGNFG